MNTDYPIDYDKYYIFDLDNCISNDEHRIAWAKRKKFDQYYAGILQDTICNTDFLVDIPGSRLIIFTGRPKKYLGETGLWLANHSIFPKAIYMRRDNDFRSSILVKREMIHLAIKHMTIKSRDEIACAYDDRQDIVDMYLQEGIKAQRLFINDRPIHGQVD